MTGSLTTLKEIANHLTRKGGEVMIAAGRATLRARIGDHRAGVNIHFRRSGIVRVTIGLSAKVDDAMRPVFALALARLNRQRLGAGFLLTPGGIAFETQVPTEADGGVGAHQLDRAIRLAIDACREAAPELVRIGERGLGPV